MAEIVVTLPDRLATAFGATAEARGRRIVEDAVIEGYRRGDLSHRDVGEALGLNYWETEAFLTENRVPLNYTIADLEADTSALETVLKRK